MENYKRKVKLSEINDSMHIGYYRLGRRRCMVQHPRHPNRVIASEDFSTTPKTSTGHPNKQKFAKLLIKLHIHEPCRFFIFETEEDMQEWVQIKEEP